MAAEIRMPQLSDTMQSGKILHWHKSEGDIVKRGDSLAEVETEKANLDIEAFQEGVLLKILVQTNETANVGDIIALIGQAGESCEVSSALQKPLPAVQEQLQAKTSAISHIETGRRAPVREPGNSRIKASPLARKLAEELHIDLHSMEGSGPDGRIIKRDIEGPPRAASTAYSPLSRTKESITIAGPPSGRTLPLSKMRETIGRRMQQSVLESPHFFISTAIDMGESKKLLQQLKEDSQYSGISINHLIIKAAAYALQKEPQVNSSIRDGQIFQPDTVNIGIVTAIDDGLLIPVIKDVHTTPLQAIIADTRAAVQRARAGQPSAADLSGGTFSISNMGMYDVESFTAIISPGQGAILAIGSMKDEAVVKSGSLSVAPMMRVTLSSDHRVIDGVTAASFLKHLKEALQNPALLLIQQNERP